VIGMELIREEEFNGYLYSTDPKKIDLDFVHRFLSNSYWAAGIPKFMIKQSIENSMSVGIYTMEKQIGFARLITDYTTFGYLADVFVDEAYRGRGLSKKLMEFILSFPELKFLRRIMLFTKDAHGLYSQYGFTALDNPDNAMCIHRKDIYKLATSK
jgi:GNAT superfamily N-acetyltransferase